MKKNLWSTIAFLIFFTIESISQTNCEIKVYDQLTKRPIYKASTTLVKERNGKLLGFSRTNGFGNSSISVSDKDSLKLYVSHSKYVQYFTRGFNCSDTIFLYPQSKVIKEVIVKGTKAVTMSGDTVSYIADSFRVPPGASVEELLKKLPGIQVAKDGSIKAQGKKVDRVLVDGDDFFGEDASAATKNLEASMIDRVEVIDVATNKSESTGSEDDKMKVINLKLKDDSKKGFFGKLEEGYSSTKRYQSTQMINLFRENTKLAGFLIADNLSSRMNWQDMQDMGISQNWTYDEDLDVWMDKNAENSTGNTFQVIPENLKTGGLLSQKLSDGSGVFKLKYNYNQSQYDGSQESSGSNVFNNSTQQYSSDNYVNSKFSKHLVGIMLEKRIDTNQKIIINASGNFGQYDGLNRTKGLIYLDSILVNRSLQNNPFEIKTESYTIDGEYERKFSKKGRLLGLKTDYSHSKNLGEKGSAMNGWLYAKNGDSSLQELNQQTDQNSLSSSLKFSGVYIEPIFLKGWNVETGLSFVSSKNTSLLNTFKLNAVTNLFEDRIASLSNNYKYIVNAWSEQLKINYRSKKFEMSAGAKFHQIGLNQDNLDSGETNLTRQFDYILPNLKFVWKYKRNSQVSLSMNKSVKPPELNSIQPFINNSNPQFIQIGNPNLTPSQNYIIKLSNSFWYPVSETNLWSSITYRMISNDFADSTMIDENGARKEYKTQVSGNSNLNFNLWYGFKIKKLGLECDPGLWMSIDNRSNYFNGTLLKTNSIWSSFNLNFQKAIDSLLTSRLECNLNWNQTTSDNPSFSNTNNLTWKFDFSQEVELPLKFKIKANLEYNILPKNSAFTESQSFALLVAHIEKSFMKENSLTARFTFYDILGQNRSINRNVYQNSISQSVSQALTQYLMLTMVYKFKNKRKTTNNETEF